MRILLIGEYSRLHNTLKEALIQLGHEVAIVGNGDGFKNFPVDYNIDAKFSKSFFPNLFRQAIFRIFKYDFATLEYGLRFQHLLPKLRDYDVVQLISEIPLQTSIGFEYRLLEKISKQNGKMFLLCSGTDTAFVKAVYDKKYSYSMLDPYLENRSTVAEYRHLLKQSTKPYLNHQVKLSKIIHGIIATDVDYAIALDGNQNYLGMIPNPIHVQPANPPEIIDKIVIFHGINRWNYHKKGTRFFEEALEIIAKKYPENVRIVVADTLPYNDYIKLYNDAHILLDQVYAYDQGYNALEAMAKGKVVFTGAEKEFMDFYNLTERVAVNALPDVPEIVKELSNLIENPTAIFAIGTRAKAFVEKEHDYLNIGKKYLEVWKDN